MFEDIKNILNLFNEKVHNQYGFEAKDFFRIGQRKKKAEVIVVCNQKGGCGKTTTAINLSAFLAKRGNKVLLIDLDTQAHASLGIGVDVNNLKWTIFDVLIHNEDFNKVITQTSVENLFIAPANHLLSGAQLQLANFVARESILKSHLNKFLLTRHFDYCIIDTSPTLNLITLNGLVAANQVLIPIQTHYFALEGMKELFFTIDVVKERLNPELKIMGILPTLFDHRIEANRIMLSELNEYFGDIMLKTVIHYTSSLIEAPRYKKPVVSYAPNSMGAFYYLTLTDELEQIMVKKEERGEEIQ